METYDRVSDSLTSIQKGGEVAIKRTLLRLKAVLIMLAVIVGIAILTYLALGNKSPEERAAQELASAVATVGELMILPEGDEPVLATVTDAEALIKQQAFFTGAVNGDQLLLFPRSLKAIIYSPSRNKIINAGPIEQSPSSASDGATAGKPSSALEGATAGKQDSLTVEVRNGSGIAGMASEVARSIATLEGFTASARDAISNDYARTVIVATKNTDEARAGANSLASALGAAVIEALPAAEKSSSADIVLILGSDNAQ